MPDPTPAQKKPLGVVLAGGASRRMGSDKAHLQHHGRSLLAHSVAALQDAGLEVLVVGRDGEPRADVHFCRDDHPGCGPLEGLATALRRSQGRPVLVVPCDVPNLDAAAVRWLLEQWQLCATTCLCSRSESGVEPLFAVYSRESLPIIENLLNNRCRSLVGAVQALDGQLLDLPQEHRTAVTDVDTPEDWGNRLQ